MPKRLNPSSRFWSAFRCVAVAVASGAVWASPARAQTHPLDALTKTEIERATAIVNAAPATAGVRFQLITLAEPAKNTVLAWRLGIPLLRRARVTAVKASRVFEIVVDLDAGTIASLVEPRGVEVPLTLNESSEAVEAARTDPVMLAALKRRGFVDMEHVDCAPFAAGYFAIKAHEGKRLLKVGCFDVSRATNNIFGWPIERLYALVDLRTMTVSQVIDLGIVPVSPQEMNFTERAIGALRPAENPTVIAQPLGANYTIEGGTVTWGNWRFHLRFESRQGTVISQARWMDAGRERSVLYQGYMSEMYVPYMDPDYGWYSRTYFDMGEYGVGQLSSPLTAGIDCPEGASFVNAVTNGDSGEAVEKPNAICIFERNNGDPAWRHHEVNNGSFEGRPGTELVVRMASQVGNYDYIMDWVFNHAAEIEVRVGATGIVALKGVPTKSMRDATARIDTRTGTLVAPNLTAIQHDHHFNYRLDLDVDGTDNSFQRDVYRQVALPASSPRRSLYQVIPEVLERESMLGGEHSHTAKGPVKLRVINETHTNAVGNPVGYEIVHVGHGSAFVDLTDWPGKRAAFLQGDVWITRHDPAEQYAAGQYVFASKSIQGLPVWIKKNRPIRNHDLVVWVNMGMQHLTRAEDIPVMPTVWHSFKLRPFNFFDRNPAVDLRTEFATPPKPPNVNPR